MHVIRYFSLLATLTLAMGAAAQTMPPQSNSSSGAIETTVDGKPVVKLGFGGRKATDNEKKKTGDAGMPLPGGISPTMGGGQRSLNVNAPAAAANADAKKAETPQLRGDSKMTSDSSIARAKREAEEKQRQAEQKAKAAATTPASVAAGGVVQPTVPLSKTR